jgi:threonine aldolase
MKIDDLKFPFSLGSDNHSGVHPDIFAALARANRGHAHSYGMDELSQLASIEFKRVFGERVEVHYVFNGTAANVLSMAPLVKSFEAIICSNQAHVHLDECSAPEKFLGTKLFLIPSEDGKIQPQQAKEYLERRGDQHHPQARVVTLTQPTELGVCYTLDELKAWRTFCTEHQLFLHIDGARLANAAAFLKASLANLTSDVGVDVVSFGGTKNGMLGAEAVLLFSEKAKEGFKFYRKQAMQLPSKSRFLAAQFHAYLENDLWKNISEHTTSHAEKLRERLKEFPEIEIAFPVQSNALFVKLPKKWIHPLRESMFFYIWDSDLGLARWMISWDWTENLSDLLIAKIREVKNVL